MKTDNIDNAFWDSILDEQITMFWVDSGNAITIFRNNNVSH